MKTNSKKMRTRTVQTQDIPVNSTPSDEKWDKLSYALCAGLVLLAVGLLGGGGYWTINGLVTDFTHVPIDWVSAVLMLLTLTAAVLAARALIWMSVFGPVLLGSRMGAWQSLEILCRKGIPISKIQPGGSTLLSTALVQSLVNRGQYEAALSAADAEWAKSGADDRQAQNLGTMCFAAGVAKQAQSDLKQAQVWNERAIGVLIKSQEQLQKPPKGVLAKLQATQSGQVLGQLKIQMAAAYFNNAIIYLNNQDLRRARENFKLAVDNAVKAPEFPQKAEIIKFGNEQVSRLKHS